MGKEAIIITINGSQVLNSFLAPTNSTVLLQLGDVVNGDVDAQDAQYITPFGFASRPSQAVPGMHGPDATRIQGLGKRDYVIGGTDIRSQPIYGNLGFGETSIYAGGLDGNAQARVMLKSDGSITLYTTSDNTANGTGVQFTISPNGLFFGCQYGSMWCDQSGWHFTTAAGAALDMAGSGLPSPLSSISSFVSITAGQFVADCPLVKLGSSLSACAPACIPVAVAQPAGTPIPPFASTVSSCVLIGI